MAENKIKEPEPPGENPEEKRKRRQKSSARKFIRYINSFSSLDRNQIVHAMPFILFITLLTIVYIGNSYYSEKIIREIDRTKSELKERNAEFVSSETERVTSIQQSRVAENLKLIGIKETKVPPVILHKISNKKKSTIK